MGVGGYHNASAALPPGSIRCPLYKRPGGPQGRFGRVRKISSHSHVARMTEYPSKHTQHLQPWRRKQQAYRTVPLSHCTRTVRTHVRVQTSSCLVLLRCFLIELQFLDGISDGYRVSTHAVRFCKRWFNRPSCSTWQTVRSPSVQVNPAVWPTVYTGLGCGQFQ